MRVPNAIEPGTCPGGLTFIAYDQDGLEVERTPIDLSVHAVNGQIERIAEGHAEACNDGRLGYLRVFDGDDGRLWLRLWSKGVIEIPRGYSGL